MTTIAFCGGGTGGHVMPAVALLEQLQRNDETAKGLLLGTGRVGELRTLEGNSIEHHPIFGGERSILSHVRAFLRARSTLKSASPDFAVGLGGYASIAGTLAAHSLGIPTFLLEQNAIAGRANDLLRRFVKYGFWGLPVQGNTFGWDGVGTPVRADIARLAQQATARVATTNNILVLGGSQGARAVSEAVVNAVTATPSTFEHAHIAHQSPADDVESVTQRYAEVGLEADVRPYFDDLPSRLSAGPLVVSRAGGTTIAELACAGVPTILIPHANAIRNHQLANARIVENFDGAVVLEEFELERLESVLGWLLSDQIVRVNLARGIRCLARPEASLAIASRLQRAARRVSSAA